MSRRTAMFGRRDVLLRRSHTRRSVAPPRKPAKPTCAPFSTPAASSPKGSYTRYWEVVGAGVGGQYFRVSSGGLMIPTWWPSGSATIAYLAPQNVS